QDVSGYPSYFGFDFSMTGGDIHRLIDAYENGEPAVTAPMNVAYVRSHQRITRKANVDAVTFRQIIHDSEYDTRTVPHDKILRLCGLESSSVTGRGRNAEALGAALLGPLGELLSRVRHLIIAPDGDLWLVPFASLPCTDGEPLLASIDMTVVDHGAELGTNPKPPAQGGAIVVIADPAFDAGGDETPLLPPLDYAREEGAAVASLLGTVVHSGVQATDELLVCRNQTGYTLPRTSGLIATWSSRI
ncbi:MAG: CHAT domain-containing protein, partial [Acidobacteria bacterium]|nr:CHAT domain-containing protein [Acidobacteriota bacterium]